MAIRMSDQYLALIHAHVLEAKNGIVRADIRIHQGEVDDVVVTISHRYSLKTLGKKIPPLSRLGHGKKEILRGEV
jgi:hypothetical protein